MKANAPPKKKPAPKPIKKVPRTQYDEETGIDTAPDATAAEETAEFLNHEENVAENSSKKLGPAVAGDYWGEQKEKKDKEDKMAKVVEAKKEQEKLLEKHPKMAEKPAPKKIDKTKDEAKVLPK